MSRNFHKSYGFFDKTGKFTGKPGLRYKLFGDNQPGCFLDFSNLDTIFKNAAAIQGAINEYPSYPVSGDECGIALDTRLWWSGSNAYNGGAPGVPVAPYNLGADLSFNDVINYSPYDLFIPFEGNYETKADAQADGWGSNGPEGFPGSSWDVVDGKIVITSGTLATVNGVPTKAINNQAGGATLMTIRNDGVSRMSIAKSDFSTGAGIHLGETRCIFKDDSANSTYLFYPNVQNSTSTISFLTVQNIHGNHVWSPFQSRTPIFGSQNNIGYLDADGVDDSLRSLTFTVPQPFHRISAFNQLSHGNDRIVYDGLINLEAVLYQSGVSPNMRVWAGGTTYAVLTGLAVGENQAVTEFFDDANSFTQINDLVPDTAAAPAGVHAQTGLSIFADYNTLRYSNARCFGMIIAPEFNAERLALAKQWARDKISALA